MNRERLTGIAGNFRNWIINLTVFAFVFLSVNYYWELFKTWKISEAFKKAEILNAEGEKRKAEALYMEIANVYPHLSGSVGKSLLAAAVVDSSMGRIDEAIGSCNRVIREREKENQVYDALECRGLLYLRRGRLEDAVKDLFTVYDYLKKGHRNSIIVSPDPTSIATSPDRLDRIERIVLALVKAEWLLGTDPERIRGIIENHITNRRRAPTEMVDFLEELNEIFDSVFKSNPSSGSYPENIVRSAEKQLLDACSMATVFLDSIAESPFKVKNSEYVFTWAVTEAVAGRCRVDEIILEHTGEK